MLSLIALLLLCSALTCSVSFCLLYVMGRDRPELIQSELIQSELIQSELMKTFFTSLNASRASGPSSRPMPDCLAPPNGVQ